MPTTTTVTNNPDFWEWLRNKVRKDKQADNANKNAPVSLELPIDDPSLVIVPTVAEKDENTTTEVDHVIFQF